MMFWYDHDMSGWGWFGASLGMLVFWGLIITALVLLFRALSRPAPGGSHDAPWTPPTPPSAEQLLAERFARGEIDEEEYQRRLRVLHSTGADLTKH
ncbi:SHOCT domain-containing protein [Streptomyces chiangmaiensis]|uniref:SHOCT domain-containing protein n=2 Tax=Streptomyces chiangmaiensis TaxID=766497 RepID=A0ABU7FMT8_9ACTN|nr:SHOCT domain-containing protein [Streptomyces chiangmaiensis]MED7825417.1 SHOCT domain-containing protein [Streptomyces chiangmaiensis]